ncbi:nuclear transport factor 2 family protein [Streptomyces odontomachi]|uniref:nuclear transport factor 2 family protein n=1 Tax=Streptomyces odontomachi TaxID=2944940 RepID=UPI0027E2E057|nr:DUF4440 domain-containing protein [Streptomyces sp. ODS25]
MSDSGTRPPDTRPGRPAQAEHAEHAEHAREAEHAEEADAAAVQAVIDGELRLLDPAVRRSPELAGRLFHPDFVEHGASGRIYDLASILTLMAEPPPPGARPSVASRIRGVRLAPDLVHLTYDSDNNGRCAHRSSLWRRTAEGWQLYFHQGTLFMPESPTPPAP